MAKKKGSKEKKTLHGWRSKIPVERAIVYLIAVFVFALPLFIWPGVTEYGYGKSIFALIGVSILLILWAGSSWLRGEWRLNFPWLTFPVLGLVLVSLLSLLGATNGRVVIQSLALLVFFFLFALVVANVVKEKRDVTLILYALLLSAFLVSVYGMLQYLGIMQGAPGRTGVGAIISTMGNRNYVGGFLAYLLFPSVILLVRLHSRPLRALAIGIIAFNFGMVMLVQQTGARIGLVFGVVAFLIAWAILRPIDPIRRNRAWLLVLLFLLVFTFLVEAPSGPLNSVVGLSADGRSWLGRLWGRSRDSTRSWDWWVGLEMFKDHPLVGAGLGNYKLDFIPYKAKFLATPQGAGYTFYILRAAQAHNEYVQAIAELGSLGILAAVAFLVMIPVSFWLRLRNNTDEGDRLDLLLLGSGIVVFLVHAVVSFPLHLPASSLVFVVALGLAFSRAYGEGAEVPIRLRGWPHKTAVAILTVFCVAVSIIAARDYSGDRLLSRGVTQLQTGQIRLAESTFEESVRRDFCPRQVYYYLATLKLQQGRYDEARADLERCLTRFVVEQVYLNLTNLAVNQGDVETARENVELVLASYPLPDVRIKAEYLSAMISLREGDYNRAISELEAHAEAHPDFERTYITLGNIFQARGTPVNARTYYEKARDIIEPKLFQAQNRLASGATLPAQEYASLRNAIQVLSQELEAVEAGLAELPPAEIWDSQPLPSYHLDTIRDVSVGDCVKLIADVVLEEPGALTDNQLIGIARQVVDEIVSSRAVNAITVAFWRPETIVDKRLPAASVDWAPDGEWDRADTVSPGDYSGHAYRVNANDTAKW